MRLACLCPTYGRPASMVENSIACFLDQDYPNELSKLIVLDDAGLIEPQTDEGMILRPKGQLQAIRAEGVRWGVLSTGARSPSLPAKFNALLAIASDWADAFVVWEDDDIYLPWHLTACAKALERGPWCHPDIVWSTYAGLQQEPAAGRFHASLAFHRDAIWPIGGWLGVMPVNQPKRGDFDQRLIRRLGEVYGKPINPNEHNGPSYVYRWGDSGGAHGSAAMRSPDDETWYDSFAIQNPDPVGRLTPAFDAVTVEVRRKILG